MDMFGNRLGFWFGTLKLEFGMEDLLTLTCPLRFGIDLGTATTCQEYTKRARRHRILGQPIGPDAGNKVHIGA